jgi:hypothetical protein
MPGLFLGLNTLTDKLFYSETGQIVVSIIFGLAFAFVFQRVCKDKKCIIIRAPDVRKMTSKVYEFEGECYKYNTVSMSCPKDSSKVISNS